MAYNAPGRHDRDGITLLQLQQRFPDEDAARKWFENAIWPDGEPYCPRCGCNDTHESTHKTMSYRCRPCKRFFSVRTGTVLKSSNLPLRIWVWAIYLEMTNLKGRVQYENPSGTWALHRKRHGIYSTVSARRS